MANYTGKKYGGRTAGTPNKVTQNMREFIEKLLIENKEQFDADFKALDKRERVEVYYKLLQFIVPKMQYVEVFEEVEPQPKQELTPEQIQQLIDKL